MKILLAMLLLASQSFAAVSFVGAGTAVGADNASVTPTLHASTAAGDLILVLAAASDAQAGTLGCPATYTSQASWAKTGTGANTVKLILCSKIAVGGDSSPTVSYTGGAAADRVAASAATFRGINTSSFINVISSPHSEGQIQNTLGPITAITPTAAGGAVIVIGAKYSWWDGGGVAVLSGDSLTWAEIAEFTNNNGDGGGLVWDYALWSGAAPTLTNKTFTITSDGQNGQWIGGMVSLNSTSSSGAAAIVSSRQRREK